MSATPPPPPPPPPAEGYGYTAQPEMSPQDQRLWATLTHIGGIFLGVIAPLITFLVFKDRGAFVREHTKTALNFQITMTIAAIIAIPLWFVLIGVLLTFAVVIVVIIFSIIAALKANAGEHYSYPLTIPLIK
ncbi:MAG TPA: DUF4870 domain-containing protein [Naasia sp.]|jgi:uncharacterized Tic20 family protein